MARKTRTQLDTEANIIKNETIVAANTATRVGTMHLSDIESEVNWEDDVVTIVSIASTDDEIPTAKAVYDAIAGITPTIPTLDEVTTAGAETTNRILIGDVTTI